MVRGELEAVLEESHVGFDVGVIDQLGAAVPSDPHPALYQHDVVTAAVGGTHVAAVLTYDEGASAGHRVIRR